MKSSVSFLKVKSSQAKLDALQGLVTNLFYRGTKAILWVPNEKSATFLDDWLWRCEAEGFLPHEVSEKGGTTPLVLSSSPLFLEGYAALINLCPALHPQWQDFSQIYELEDYTSPEKQQASQVKRQHYQKAGLALA